MSMKKRERPWRDRDWMIQKYETEGLSVNDMANIVGCSRACILEWMNRHRIVPREVKPPEPLIVSGNHISISNELEIGRAGEHLVCADLILQGYPAYLSAQGLPYDVVAESPKGLVRVQVKTKTKTTKDKVGRDVWRYNLRSGKNRARRAAGVECFAFVAIGIDAIAYVSLGEMLTKRGKIKQCIDFYESNQIEGRLYPNGNRRTDGWRRTFSKYHYFPFRLE